MSFLKVHGSQFPRMKGEGFPVRGFDNLLRDWYFDAD